MSKGGWGPPSMVPTQYPFPYGHFMDQYWSRHDFADKKPSFSSNPIGGYELDSFSGSQDPYSNPILPERKSIINHHPKPLDDHVQKAEARIDETNAKEEPSVNSRTSHDEFLIKREPIKLEPPVAPKEPSTTNPSDYLSDQPSVKPRIEMSCQFCGANFDDLEIIISHINLHLESQRNCEVNLRCLVTGCSYKPKQSVKPAPSNLEPSSHHQEITVFTQLKSIQDHVRSRHLNIAAWKCMFCDKPFNSKASLDYHIKMHNDPSKEYCKICKHFKSIDKIASHDLVKCAKLANTERKFKCEDCGKGFKGAANLALHRVIHSGERFICDFCGKSFTQKGNRKTHIMKKHGDLLVTQSLLATLEK